jgi:hypothetical protein
VSLRAGLANLRASRDSEPEAQAEPVTAEIRGPTPPLLPASEKRETFSTRIRPSVRYALKRQLLEMQEQGEKVRMEDVLEALILKYVEDEEFRRALSTA